MLIQNVGNSEIYILDLETRVSKRITNSFAIDVSASFSPDGKKIVFNSDRNGRRHLYVAESDGKNLKRISKGVGSYYTPRMVSKRRQDSFYKGKKEDSFILG